MFGICGIYGISGMYGMCVISGVYAMCGISGVYGMYHMPGIMYGVLHVNELHGWWQLVLIFTCAWRSGRSCEQHCLQGKQV